MSTLPILLSQCSLLLWALQTGKTNVAAAQPVFTNTYTLSSGTNMAITAYPSNLVTASPPNDSLSIDVDGRIKRVITTTPKPESHQVIVERPRLEVVTNWVTVSKTYPVAAEGNLATWWGKITINQTGIITTNLVLETSMGTLRQVVGQEAMPSLTRSFDEPRTFYTPAGGAK